MSSRSSHMNGNVFIICFLALWLTACGHEPVRRVSTEESRPVEPAVARKAIKRTLGEQAAVVALRQVGVPYLYGGSTTNGFDCSGLVQYAYATAGKHISRTTGGQWQQLSPVDEQRIRVGDLLFFNIEGKISHVGLYLGDRRFVHAPSSGRHVSVENLDSEFYRRAFVRAARP